MTEDIQTVREALGSDSVRFYSQSEAEAALARVEAVVKAARHVVTHGSVGVPALTRALAALDPTEDTFWETPTSDQVDTVADPTEAPAIGYNGWGPDGKHTQRGTTPATYTEAHGHRPGANRGNTL